MHYGLHHNKFGKYVNDHVHCLEICHYNNAWQMKLQCIC